MNILLIRHQLEILPLVLLDFINTLYFALVFVLPTFAASFHTQHILLFPSKSSCSIKINPKWQPSTATAFGPYCILLVLQELSLLTLFEAILIVLVIVRIVVHHLFSKIYTHEDKAT